MLYIPRGYRIPSNASEAVENQRNGMGFREIGDGELASKIRG